MNKAKSSLSGTLWRLYHRPDPPIPWQDDGNLPWNDPDFSRRMLREHLDQSHGAASRVTAERTLQIDWLWEQLGLREGSRLLDVTCGPGLYAVDFAGRGCRVTGIDFGPASIAYARELAAEKGVALQCEFIEEDVRRMQPPVETYSAALFLYGQLGVFPKENAQGLLEKIAAALQPGGRLCVELLNPERVDKKQSSWWFTDDQGLWGERPFLHLGERHWLADEQISVERFTIINLETGTADHITLCDQIYTPQQMAAMLRQAGFSKIDYHQDWAGLDLYDAPEWIVTIAEK